VHRFFILHMDWGCARNAISRCIGYSPIERAPGADQDPIEAARV